jgi:hypothetical protein
VIDASGYGQRIRQALLDYQATVVRGRYSDAQFAHDVGIAERGKPYGRSSVTDWVAERTEPSRTTWIAMELVLKQPGFAVYGSFGVWPQPSASYARPLTDRQPDYLRVAEAQGAAVVSARSDAAFRPREKEPSLKLREAGGAKPAKRKGR